MSTFVMALDAAKGAITQGFLLNPQCHRYPAAMAIKFDAEELIGKLDAVRATQLPYAASRAMDQLGWELKSKAWPAFSLRTFNTVNPVPFTTGNGGVGGLLYKHERGSSTLTISLDRPAPKGQDPARYLAPSESGGPIYITRFTRALGYRGIKPSNYTYAAPVIDSGGFAGEINEYGRVRNSYYKSILAGLDRGMSPAETKSGNRSRSKYTGYRFFSVPDASRPRSGSQHLAPGIYRAKGRSELQLLFLYLNKVPTVASKWSFEEFAEQETQRLLPGILSKALEEALR